MQPLDPRKSRVRIATVEAGPYNLLALSRSLEMVEGTEGGSTLRWFGGESRKTGDPTLGGSLPVWYRRDDTSGQVVARNAKRTGTLVWLQLCPEGVAAGAKVDQFQAEITEVRMGSDSTADGVEGTFSYVGVPTTYKEITLI